MSNERTFFSFLNLFQRNQTPQRNVVPQNNDDDEESPLVINEEPEMKRGRHENLPTSGSMPQLPVPSQFPGMPSNMPAGFNQYMLLQVMYTFLSMFSQKNYDFIQTDIKISISGDALKCGGFNQYMLFRVCFKPFKDFELHTRVQKYHFAKSEKVPKWHF